MALTMQDSIVLSVRIEKDDALLLKRIAVARDRKPSYLARRYIKDGLERDLSPLPSLSPLEPEAVESRTYPVMEE